MPRFSTLIQTSFLGVIIIFFCPFALAEHTTLKLNTKQNFNGILSSDFKSKPFISTQDSAGLNVRILLSLPPDLSLKAMTLRGKPVRATIKITKKLKPRLYEGALEAIDLEKINPIQ